MHIIVIHVTGKEKELHPFKPIIVIDTNGKEGYNLALQVTQEEYDRWQAHLSQSEGKSINNTHPRKVTNKREEEILREYSRNNGVMLATTKSAKCSKKTLQTILKSRGLY